MSKVQIGSRQSCSCSHPIDEKGVCIHILFVMVKVLRISPENPVVWQKSLNDAEIEQVG
jgi:hypothetical protein